MFFCILKNMGVFCITMGVLYMCIDTSGIMVVYEVGSTGSIQIETNIMDSRGACVSGYLLERGSVFDIGEFARGSGINCSPFCEKYT